MMTLTGPLALLAVLGTPQEIDLQIATNNNPVAGNGFVAVATSEGMNDVDLNGDGEIAGWFIAVTEPDGTAIALLEGYGWTALTDGDWIAYHASEYTDDADVNGDGDAIDTFPVLHHVPSGITRTLPYAVVPLPQTLPATKPIVQDGFWAFRVRESSQGQDLNGDGDLLDSVQYVHDINGNVTIATGIASTGQHVARGWTIFTADEAAQSADLNGDGDTLDRVLHALRESGGTAVNLGVAGSIERITYPLLGILVDEAQQAGEDLNGDGEADDVVLHVLDLSSGSLVNTQAATLVTADSIGGDSETYVSSGQAIAFRTPEFSQGVDLNGDGDLLDRVVQVWDGRRQKLVNLAIGDSLFSLFALDRPSIDYPIVAVSASESAQGVDYSGDGNLGAQVLFTYDLTTETLTNTTIRSARPFVHSGHVFSATEGSGFAGDLTRYDAFTGELLPLGATGVLLQLEFSGETAYFAGKVPGAVLSSFWSHELATGTTTNLGGLPAFSDLWELGDTALFYQHNAPSPPHYLAFALALPE